MDYLIEDIKCGISAGGMACGPVGGIVVSSVKYNDGNQSMWLNICEIDGMPEFHLSEYDIYDELIEEEDTEEYQVLLDSTYINEFNGISLESYSDIFSSIVDATECDKRLIRLIIIVTRCDFSELDDIKNNSINKYVSEIDIPISDVEEDEMA